jgi:hypothetical protein
VEKEHLTAATTTDLLFALRAIRTGSTRPMGNDSTGQEYCHVRAVAVQRALETLARAEAEISASILTKTGSVEILEA